MHEGDIEWQNLRRCLEQYLPVSLVMKSKSGSTANRTNRKAVLPFFVTESD